eukprot:3352842-Heterocapsa_arctica.AAC.1
MDFHGANLTRGMAVLDELQQHRTAMLIIGNVIAAVQAQDSVAKHIMTTPIPNNFRRRGAVHREGAARRL